MEQVHSPLFFSVKLFGHGYIIVYFVNLDFLRLNLIIDKLFRLELFSGINSSVCCLFESQCSVIVNCNQRVDKAKRG